MINDVKKYLSKDYLNLVLRSKLPFLRTNPVRIGGLVYTYLDWQQFYGLFYEIFVEKIYRLDEIGSPRHIIDAGANIGLATAYFHKQYPEATIECFEPNPEVLECLNCNIRTNNIRATVHSFAIGNREGVVVFNIDARVKGSSSANAYGLLSGKNHTQTQIDVPIRKLSSFISGAVDILKMDIEGGEWDVMADLIDNNKLKYVRNLLVEFHYDPKSLPRTLGEFVSMLEYEGYFVYVSKRQATYFPKRILHSHYIFAFREKGGL